LVIENKLLQKKIAEIEAELERLKEEVNAVEQHPLPLSQK
jgi:hypothetical protein